MLRIADYRDVWLKQLYRKRSGNNEPVSYIHALYDCIQRFKGTKSHIFCSEIGWRGGGGGGGGGGGVGRLSQPHL